MTSDDTWTPEGQARRTDEIAKGYFKSRSFRSLVRFIGLSASDIDLLEGDTGEPPVGAHW